MNGCRCGGATDVVPPLSRFQGQASSDYAVSGILWCATAAFGYYVTVNAWALLMAVPMAALALDQTVWVWRYRKRKRDARRGF